MSEQMQSGKELNKLIGEKLFGYNLYHYEKDYEENCYFMLMDSEFDPIEPVDGRRKTEDEAWNDSPDFSGSWDGMGLVLDEMYRRGFWEFIERRGMNTYQAIRSKFWHSSEGYWLPTVHGPTPPHAVCMAALEALKALDEQS